jgi:uncharacterized protein
MPDGDVYKCWGEVGMTELRCGNILSWDEYSANHLAWIGFDPLSDQECVKCKFLPVCMGDCPYYNRFRFPKTERCVAFKYTYGETIQEYVKNQLSDRFPTGSDNGSNEPSICPAD